MVTQDAEIPLARPTQATAFLAVANQRARAAIARALRRLAARIDPPQDPLIENIEAYPAEPSVWRIRDYDEADW